MSENRTVIWGANPVKLGGNEVKAGVEAPDATVLNNKLQPVKISDYFGKVIILSSVPSLDTGVCDKETRRFNEIAAGLGDDVVILTISADLPFTQARWCGAAGVDKVVTLSDHREMSFGKQYGVIIEDLRILARCVFVVDRKNIVQNVQLVRETGQEPDYENVIKAVKKLL